ncbi:unnamed protein product, partial [Brachionus calyciflorus]
VPVIDLNGELSINLEEKKKNHFDSLLNRPKPVGDANVDAKEFLHTLDIKTSKITLAEVRESLRKLKNNNASGFDGIYPELLKHGAKPMEKILLKLFNKTFDSLHQESLWRILRYYGHPFKIINIIKDLYDGAECCVKVGNDLTDWFKIETGVRQGCVLSSLLFAIAIEWVLSHFQGTTNGIPWIKGKQLHYLDFADDIAIFSSKQEHMHEKTNTIYCAGLKIGLKINEKKTVLMKINQDSDVELNENISTKLMSLSISEAKYPTRVTLSLN